MVEGMFTGLDCGCWIIRDYQSPRKILRFHACAGCIEKGLDMAQWALHIDKEISVSASDEDEELQLWLT